MSENMASKNTYTHMKDLDLYACNDCGAYGSTPAKIVHYENCQPGCSEYWKKYYDDQPDDELTDEEYETYLIEIEIQS